MNLQPLKGKTYLVTGGAHRVGAMIALAIAKAGGNVIIHHFSSCNKAKELLIKIKSLDVEAWTLQANLEDEIACKNLIKEAFSIAPIDGVINSAAHFEKGDLKSTKLLQWHKHIQLNLTAPFILSQAFSKLVPKDQNATIINIVDLCNSKPRTTHIAYSISKAALEHLTHILAISLAPNITVNALALGAILPPSDGESIQSAIKDIPIARVAHQEELEKSILFLLTNCSYITGETLHLDGGKHLI